MKKTKKLLALIAAAAVVATAAFAAKPETAKADLSETSAFDAIRITQVKGNKNTPSERDDSLEVPWWAGDGLPSGFIRFDMGVSESDWTEATALRIRFTSVDNGEYGPKNSNGNNIAVGFAAASTSGSGNLILKTGRPRLGSVKFTYPNGKNGPVMYAVGGDETEYFNVAREYTGCVELALDGDTFKRVAAERSKTFYSGDEPADADADLSQVSHIFIQLQPVSFRGTVINVGNAEIKVNGKWKTVVDMTKATIVEKQDDKSWEETISSLVPNACMLDPVYKEKANGGVDVNTSACTIEKMEADPCVEHYDANGDSHCDRCFTFLTHYGWDNNLDGLCDDCEQVVCDENAHTDVNFDGICDVCDHYIDPSGSGRQTDPKHYANPINIAFYVVGGLLLAGGVAMAIIAFTRKKKETE